MKRITSVLLICVCVAFSVCAQTNLKESEVSNETVLRILKKDYTATIDDDNDICIKNESNAIVYLTVDTKNSVLNVYCAWDAVTDISEQRAARICNTWNSKKMFSSFYFVLEKKPLFVYDYYISYIGGINEENLLDTIDWIFAVTDGFDKYLESEDAI